MLVGTAVCPIFDLTELPVLCKVGLAVGAVAVKDTVLADTILEAPLVVTGGEEVLTGSTAAVVAFRPATVVAFRPATDADRTPVEAGTVTTVEGKERERVVMGVAEGAEALIMTVEVPWLLAIVPGVAQILTTVGTGTGGPALETLHGATAV